MRAPRPAELAALRLASQLPRRVHEWKAPPEPRTGPRALVAEEREDEIRAVLALDHLTRQEQAARLGVERHTLAKYITQLGIERQRAAPARVADRRADEIRAAISMQNLTRDEQASLLGVTRQTLYVYLRALGIVAERTSGRKTCP